MRQLWRIAARNEKEEGRERAKAAYEGRKRYMVTILCIATTPRTALPAAVYSMRASQDAMRTALALAWYASSSASPYRARASSGAHALPRRSFSWRFSEKTFGQHQHSRRRSGICSGIASTSGVVRLNAHMRRGISV